MLRSIALLVALLYVATAGAQQSGSQIRATPQVPQPTNAASTEEAAAPTIRANNCGRLQGEARKRCLQQEHAPKTAQQPAGSDSASGIDSGPGSTGMGSGAGASASGSGGGAPR